MKRKIMKVVLYSNVLLAVIFYTAATPEIMLKPLYFSFEILKEKGKAGLSNIAYPATLLMRENNKYCEYISGGEFTLLSGTGNEFVAKNAKNDTYLKVKIKESRDSKMKPQGNNKFYIEYAITVNFPLQENFISFCGSETIFLDKPYIIHTTTSENNEKIDTLPYMLIFSLKKFPEKDYWGNMAGIGVRFNKDKEGLVEITDVYPGTPAEKIGIRRGDKVIEIDGNYVAPMSMEEVREKLFGAVGSKVKLKILDREKREKSLEVERKIWRFIEDEN